MNVTIVKKIHPNFRKKRPHAPVDDDALRIAAREFGRKGGQARAKKLTPRERSIAASRAARARWGSRLRRMAEAAGLKTGREASGEQEGES